MLRSLLVMSLLMLPAGAAAQTRVDFDKHQDFLQYRTFDVAIGPLVQADGTVDEQNTLNEDRLRRAIASELSARGLESTVVGVDLEVRVSGRNSERTEVRSSGFNHFPTFYYRPVRLRNGRMPISHLGRLLEPSVLRRCLDAPILEGALTIDVVDRDTGRLVYRAQVNDEIGGNLDKTSPSPWTRPSRSSR